MYGYLRISCAKLPYKLTMRYQKSYCTLCQSLWQNYGLDSRLILSYDILFMAMLCGLEYTDADYRIVCRKKVSIEKNSYEWMKLSAFSILLAAEKVKDDIQDEKSFLSMAIGVAFKKTFDKAEKDFPVLKKILENGFCKIYAEERKGASVWVLAKKFSDVMSQAFEYLFPEKAYRKSLLEFASVVVYFFDALDDLDNDIKNGQYNPLAAYSKNKKELIENRLDVVEEFILKSVNSFELRGKLDFKNEFDRILLNILEEFLPEKMLSLLYFTNNKSNNYCLKLEEMKSGVLFV